MRPLPHTEEPRERTLIPSRAANEAEGMVRILMGCQSGLVLAIKNSLWDLGRPGAQWEALSFLQLLFLSGK